MSRKGQIRLLGHKKAEKPEEVRRRLSDQMDNRQKGRRWKKYVLSEEQRCSAEGMRLPFAVCQFLKTGVVALAVSDGYCERFGCQDRDQGDTA